jgi:hypothetical protein
VDLSQRSKYAQLRIVAGAGHRMHQEKPETIAQAIHDVGGSEAAETITIALVDALTELRTSSTLPCCSRVRGKPEVIVVLPA